MTSLPKKPVHRGRSRSRPVLGPSATGVPVTVGTGRVYLLLCSRVAWLQQFDMTCTWFHHHAERRRPVEDHALTGVVYGSGLTTPPRTPTSTPRPATRAPTIQWASAIRPPVARSADALPSVPSAPLVPGPSLWAGGDFNFSYTFQTAGQWSGGARLHAAPPPPPCLPLQSARLRRQREAK